MKFGIEDFKDLRIFQWIWTLLISYISWLIIVSITIFTVCIRIYFQTNINKTLLIVSFSVIEVIRIWYRIFKNFYIYGKDDKKLDIIIAIDSKLVFDRYLLKSDFINELKWNINKDKFKIRILPQRYFKHLFLKEKKKVFDLEYVKKLNEKVKWEYWICWTVDKQKDNGLKCYIETAALVFHSDIDKKLNEEFGKEFWRVYEQHLSFLDERYKSWIKFSGEYNAVVALYIIWLASLISLDPYTAWELHERLSDDIMWIKETAVERTSKDENVFRSMLENIKVIQRVELRIINDLHYYWKFYNWNIFSSAEYERIKRWKEILDKREMVAKKLSNQVYMTPIYANNAILSFIKNRDVELARFYMKKSRQWNDTYEYSLVFLDLYSKKYDLAKNRIKKLFEKKWKNNLLIKYIEIINFIEQLIEIEDWHQELLYRESLILYLRLWHLEVAKQKIEEYIERSRWEQKWFEYISPLELKDKIDRDIKK